MAETINKMDSRLLRDFFAGGCNNLSANKEVVNSLNVFPVPDGDTGINMYLTISSAMRQIEGKKYTSCGPLAQDFSMGALLGARGNSGVILSQIMRGLFLAIGSKDELTPADLAAAFQKGVDLSYKSVMKPVEGTILTVFREFTAAAVKAAEAGADIIGVVEAGLEEGHVALKNTPNLLPPLKEAGVVDAGGKGLLVIMEGGLRALNGEIVSAGSDANVGFGGDFEDHEPDIEFAYDTQLLVKGENLPLDVIREHIAMDPPGDCLLVVGTEEVIKIHYHTNYPWKVLEYCSKFGTIHDIVIENMRDQAHELINHDPDFALSNAKPAIEDIPACKTGVIAVCAGDGLEEIFRDMGAAVISGGQTMNPSAADLLDAIEKINAEEVVLLPNNSNIVLTAQQAQKMAEKPVYVVPSKYVTQGISALLNYDPEATGEDNYAAMMELIGGCVSGEVTYAVRDTKFSGFEIAENDILAMKNGDLVACGQEVEPTVLELVEKMVSDEHGIISLFYGHTVDEQEAVALATKLEEIYPDLDVEYHYGGQPLYHYLISVE
ncbi:MAG: DAK2 domain-containing protein [Firmicutes bacterium]|nr:DAK2 domain-containing protein [Bacillota bacterium]